MRIHELSKVEFPQDDIVQFVFGQANKSASMTVHPRRVVEPFPSCHQKDGSCQPCIRVESSVEGHANIPRGELELKPLASLVCTVGQASSEHLGEPLELKPYSPAPLEK